MESGYYSLGKAKVLSRAVSQRIWLDTVFPKQRGQRGKYYHRVVIFVAGCLWERPCHQRNAYNNLRTVSLMFRRSSVGGWLPIFET